MQNYFESHLIIKNPSHHIIKTLRQYDLNPSICYKDTAMYEYLKYFQPKSISELINNVSQEEYLPLFVYPWGTFQKIKIQSKNLQKHQDFVVHLLIHL